jgi:hypothetical protein
MEAAVSPFARGIRSTVQLSTALTLSPKDALYVLYVLYRSALAIPRQTPARHSFAADQEGRGDYALPLATNDRVPRRGRPEMEIGEDGNVLECFLIPPSRTDRTRRLESAQTVGSWSEGMMGSRFLCKVFRVI